MIHKVIRQARRLPAQAARHLGEALRLDEVVEGEGREHGAVAVHVRFDEERGAAHAVEVDFAVRVAVGVYNQLLLARSVMETERDR
jgi:hypothetical protein